jgi:hypothetical protein
MQKWIHFFGYNQQEGNEKTGFFKYDEAEVKANEEHYYGFRKTNKAALEKVVKDGGWKGPKYTINSHPECFESFPKEVVNKVQYPGRDFACKKLYGKPYTVDDDKK